MGPSQQSGEIPGSASSAVNSEPARVMRFRDRQDAGRRLATMLGSYAAEEPIVLALPRGGAVVGHEVARRLQAQFDVLVVRKVGVPWQPELGVGAVAEGGHVYVSPEAVVEVGLTEEELAAAVQKERSEVDARVRRFHGRGARPQMGGRVVILVDDGIATGVTVRAALQAIRGEQPREIVLAVPVASPELLDSLASEVDRIVCPLAPVILHAVGFWYEDFSQVDDDEVVRLLERSRSVEAGHSLDTVGVFMRPVPTFATPTMELFDAAVLMRERGIRHVPVVDGERRVIGVLSDRDVRAALGDPRRFLDHPGARERFRRTSVADVMSKPAITVRADAPITTAVDQLLHDKVGALPVVDDQGRILGILSYLDFIQILRDRL